MFDVRCSMLDVRSRSIFSLFGSAFIVVVVVVLVGCQKNHTKYPRATREDKVEHYNVP